MKIYATIKEQNFEFENVIEEDERRLLQNGQPVDYDMVALGDGRYSLIKNNRAYIVHLVRNGELSHVHVLGEYFPVQVEDERQRKLKELVKSSHQGPAEQVLKAPIPGLVIKIHAAAGETIAKGDPLLVLEAMKMENIIKAPCDCTVQEVYVSEKDAVQQNQQLLKLVTGE